MRSWAGKKLEKVPHETYLPDTGGTGLDPGSANLATIINSNARLARALETQAQSALIQAEAVKGCQEDQRKLISMLEANLGADRQAAEASIVATFAHYITVLGVREGLWKDEKAGRDEIRKTLVANVPEKKGAGSAHDLGSRNRT